MPKRKQKRIQLLKSVEKEPSPAIVDRIRQLIKGRELTDIAIVRLLEKKNILVLNSFVSRLRHRMLLRPVSPRKLNAATTDRAKPLIVERKLNDQQIADLMKKQGFQISGSCVSALRRSMDIPTLHPKPLSPKIVKKAKRLIAKRTLNDKAIARLMTIKGFLISIPSVAKIRHSMDIPPVAPKGTSKKVQMRANQIKKLRPEFKELSQKQIKPTKERAQRIEDLRVFFKTQKNKAERLKSWRKLNEALLTYRQLYAKARGSNPELERGLLQKIVDVEEVLEALKPLLLENKQK